MKIKTVVKDSYKLGQVLQQCRMQQNLSQRELAKKLGISQRWVWEMEQGKPGLLMDRLFTMMNILNITMFTEFEAIGIESGDEHNEQT